MKHLVLVGRIVFGAWMLINGANHFFLHLYPEPVGHTPLAIQLMTALKDGWMLDVAMVIQLVAGALILVGVLVPVAICVVMPISVCAAFWAVILEHQPVGALLALVAVGLNALLCLAYLDYYQGMLQRRALTFGEGEAGAMNFENTFASPMGRTARGPFVAALIVLALAVAFYFFLVHAGRNGEWVLVTLLYPGFVLVARRLHDMGQTAWLLVAPLALIVMSVWMHMSGQQPQLQAPVCIAAVLVSAGFVLWGLVGKGQADSNKFGVAA